MLRPTALGTPSGELLCGLSHAGCPPGSSGRHWAADIEGVRHHCTQCLTELFANGEMTPAGETLCTSCYSALWGPKVTDEFRGLVRLHTGSPLRSRLVAEPATT